MTMKKPMQKLLAVAIAMTASTATAAPRTLPNGAPAPGNTVAKGERYGSAITDTKRALRSAKKELVAAIDAEKVAAADLTAQPRTLANGAPACGNTSSKAATCTVEQADAEWNERVQRLVQAGVTVRAAQARVTSLTTRLAKLADDSDDVALATRS